MDRGEKPAKTRVIRFTARAVKLRIAARLVPQICVAVLSNKLAGQREYSELLAKR